MQERTVRITAHDDAIENLQLTEVLRAIGYASMWGNSPRVEIHIDKDMEISASHQRVVDEENLRYAQYFFMCGIYRDEKYSFHS